MSSPGKYVVYVYVGSMPPHKAKAFIDETKKSFDEAHFFSSDDKVVYFATVSRDSGVEKLPN